MLSFVQDGLVAIGLEMQVEQVIELKKLPAMLIDRGRNLKHMKLFLAYLRVYRLGIKLVHKDLG